MKDEQSKDLHPESAIIHYGHRQAWSEGAMIMPIYTTSTFQFKNAEEGADIFSGKKPDGLVYSRMNNPNLEEFEDRFKILDGAEDAAVFASGMAAINSLIFTFVNRGEIVLHSTPIYGGTATALNEWSKKIGFNTVEIRHTDGEHHWNSFAQKNTGVSLILIESPANPTNVLFDLKFFSGIAKKMGAIFAVDNTFLGPLWQRPFEYGADLSVYSATKYIGGHSDLLAGVISGSEELIGRIKKVRSLMGNMGNPFESYLLTRSLQEIHLRTAKQLKNAKKIAEFLANHEKVESVFYLGLLKNKNNYQYKIYRKLKLRPGAMISFNIKGGKEEAFRFLNALQMIGLAVSLGATESLAEHPYFHTHAGVSALDKRRSGITENMIRLSVGIEHYEDIIKDLQRGFGAI